MDAASAGDNALGLTDAGAIRILELAGYVRVPERFYRGTSHSWTSPTS